MGWLEGLLTGYMDRGHAIAEEKMKEAMLANQREAGVYNALLNSQDPKIRQLAATGILESASPRKRRGGLQGWMGEMERNPTYSMLEKYMTTPQVIGQKITTTPGQLGSTQTGGYLTSEESMMPPAAPAAAMPSTSPTEGGPMAAPKPWVNPGPWTGGLGETSGAPEALQRPSDTEPVLPLRDDVGVSPPSLPLPGVPTYTPGATDPNQPTFGASTVATPPPAPPGQGLRKTVNAPVQPTTTSEAIWGLPQAFPTQEDLTIRQKGAQLQGEFKSLRDIYLETGMTLQDATQQAATDVVGMHRRAGGTTQYQMIELEYEDPRNPGQFIKELGSYDRAGHQFLGSQGQPIAGKIRKAMPASAGGMGVYVNQAMRDLHVTELDMRNNPMVAQRVIERSQDLAAEQAGDIFTGRAGAAAIAGLSADKQLDAINRWQDTWRKATASTHQMARQLQTMKAGYNQFVAGKDPLGGPQAVLIGFQRMLEPDSVVMPAEYARTPEGMALLSRVQGYYDKWFATGGAGIPPEELAGMISTAEEIMRGLENWNSGIQRQLHTLATRFGIDSNLIFGTGPAVPGTVLPSAAPGAIRPPAGSPPPNPKPNVAPNTTGGASRNWRQNEQGQYVVTIP